MFSSARSYSGLRTRQHAPWVWRFGAGNMLRITCMPAQGDTGLHLDYHVQIQYYALSMQRTDMHASVAAHEGQLQLDALILHSQL